MGDDNELTPILVAIARLEGKLDAMAAEHATRISQQESTTKDLDGRLRGVERRVWSAAGVATVLATIAGPLVTHLLNN